MSFQNAQRDHFDFEHNKISFTEINNKNYHSHQMSNPSHQVHYANNHNGLIMDYQDQQLSINARHKNYNSKQSNTYKNNSNQMLGNSQQTLISSLNTLNFNNQNVSNNSILLTKNNLKQNDAKSLSSYSTCSVQNNHMPYIVNPDETNFNELKPNHNSSNHYFASPSANHNGSYRQTLNPSIYNAYRLSSNSHQSPTPAISPTRNIKPPVVEVIETYCRVPQVPGKQSKKQDRFDKAALYKTVCKKTELCTNWELTGGCTYGNKCHFAHGKTDLKSRMRVENYKTQPCCDPAREGCRRCMYGRRCNYCHPGEAIRRPHPTPYYDQDYYEAIAREFGEENEYPFGIYI